MVEPYDEPEIDGNETIIRRISPEQHIVPDHNSGGNRISSKAYSPSSGPTGGMSVDILGLIEKDGVDAKEFVTTPVYTGSVAFPANAARKLNLWIGYEPVLPDNPYHGEVWRNVRSKGFTRAQKRGLQAESQWFVEIPGVSIATD